jgi:hypothetical protein
MVMKFCAMAVVPQVPAVKSRAITPRVNRFIDTFSSARD